MLVVAEPVHENSMELAQSGLSKIQTAEGS